MSKNNSKQNSVSKILFFLIGGIVAALALFFIILAISGSKPTYGFYKIPESLKNQLIQTLNSENKKNPTVLELDASLPLSSQTKSIKKCQMIFVQQDYDSKSFCFTNKTVKAIDGNLIKDYPSTIVDSVNMKDKKIKYLPFLYDFYQIDVNYSDFLASGVKNIDNWDDFYKVLSNQRKMSSYPLLANFSNNCDFLDIFGALFEAQCSSEDYKKLCDKLYDLSSKNQNKEIAEYLTKDPNVVKTISVINDLFANGLLKKDVMDFESKDGVYLANELLTSNFICKLSEHRQLNQKKANEYKCIYFPSVNPGQQNPRMFAAPEYSAICVKANKTNKTVLQRLATTDQTKISTETGLSPVDLHCSVADRQADDVRYWLAASHGPLIPLSGALVYSESKNAAAQTLKSCLVF